MSFFDGRAEPGESLVLIQGTVRLRAVLREPFEGGPGHRAALELYGVEVISGNFPSHIEELTLNANGWEIYRDGDPTIPALPEPSGYDRAIEALTILGGAFRRSGGDESFTLGYGTIYSNISPEELSEREVLRLDELGWHADWDDENFYHSV